MPALEGIRDVGLLGADGVVIASDAPTADKAVGNAMKGLYGARIGVCTGAGDEVTFQSALDA